MMTTPNGKLLIQRAAESVPPGCAARLVIAIRADHDAKYQASEVMRRVFGDYPDLLVVDHDTNGPAATVALMIERAGIRGPILVKDCDSFFEPAPMPPGSSVAVCDLRRNLDVSRVGAKSFVSLNSDGLVCGISEKEVSSNFISIGLYGFADADRFQAHYQSLTNEPQSGEIFLSHVIARALQAGEAYHPQFVSGLIDAGTLEDWRSYTAKCQLLISDIDGVVFENQSEYFPPFWGDPVTPIQANVDRLLQAQRSGAQLVFVTSRPEKYRQSTLDALLKAGLTVHALVMGCSHSKRVLINDYAESNPYPTAISINVQRNTPQLPNLLG